MDKIVDEHKPLVSVVMSVYNGASYVKEAIESILNQTYVHFEFLIINDGSTDSSLEIIYSFSDPRIKLIDNGVNKGLIYSLNKGLDEAQGKYIARMDADDISLPTRFEKQVAYLERHQTIGIVGSDYIAFTNDSSKYITSIRNSSQIKTFLLFGATVCHPTLMLRKSVIDECNFRYSSEAKHVEDFDLWTRMSVHTHFANIDEALLKYRDHPGQVSHAYSYIQKENSDIVRKHYLSALGFFASDADLAIHNQISSNQRITSKNDLIHIKHWLENLIAQNNAKEIISSVNFNQVMAKQWLDCCGNTNLGLWAYFKFQKSKLKNSLEQTSVFHFKLLAKCLIRWIK